MATINYADKVALDINPDIADINKVNASDMNLLKQVGNQTLKTIGVFTDDWSSSATYAVKDIVIYDNRVFENLTGNNTATPPDQDTTNWEETTIAKLSAGVNIPIQDTAPDNPEEDDLWIDTSEPEGIQEAIKNEYSESTTDTYSCDYINKIGTIISNTTTTTTATQGQGNTLSTLDIPKGTWIVYGHWEYPGNDLSSWTTIWGINYSGAVSCYDNDGYVNMTIQGIAISDGNTVATLTMWPRNKTVSTTSEMWAIKISN